MDNIAWILDDPTSGQRLRTLRTRTGPDQTGEKKHMEREYHYELQNNTDNFTSEKIDTKYNLESAVKALKMISELAEIYNQTINKFIIITVKIYKQTIKEL